MNQKTRILIGLGVLALIVLLVAGVELLRRSTVSLASAPGMAAVVTLAPGNVPVYWNGQLVAGFSPDALDSLEKASFVEPLEGKTEEGWLVRDVLLLYLKPEQLQPGTPVTISSASRKKSAQLTWAEIEDSENMVLFDLSNRGTLKLASRLEKLDTREEWVQDVDRIDVGDRPAGSP